MQHDYAVFIGRFQPFHNGHLEACKTALNQAKHLIILVGSAAAARNIRNPFSFAEREQMIRGSLSTNGISFEKFSILPIRDYFYSDNLWIADVQKLVYSVAPANAKVALFGYKKDETSYYLDLFPQWNFIAHKPVLAMDATSIRMDYLRNPTDISKAKNNVPKTVIDWLNWFATKPECLNLNEELRVVTAYKESWSSAPYPPTFTTVDAVVCCAGHLLLVKRKDHPGKGLTALPGGFIKPEESLLDACIRELREETRIKVPEPVLRGSLVSSRVFDHPLRSLRGRTITHAYFFQLSDKELPKVKGADDAEKAFWLPLNQVLNNPTVFFEDHFQILECFIPRK